MADDRKSWALESLFSGVFFNEASAEIVRPRKYRLNCLIFSQETAERLNESLPFPGRECLIYWLQTAMNGKIRQTHFLRDPYRERTLRKSIAACNSDEHFAQLKTLCQNKFITASFFVGKRRLLTHGVGWVGGGGWGLGAEKSQEAIRSSAS